MKNNQNILLKQTDSKYFSQTDSGQNCEIKRAGIVPYKDITAPQAEYGPTVAVLKTIL
jgi:hypothetical protein